MSARRLGYACAMARNTTRIHATPEEVFDVLDDAHAYPRWVVGTRRVRGVDPDWPAVGSRFHHAIGTFVAELHDSSMVLDRRRPELMELEVRFRPTGVAWVRICVERQRAGEPGRLRGASPQRPLPADPPLRHGSGADRPERALAAPAPAHGGAPRREPPSEVGTPR